MKQPVESPDYADFSYTCTYVERNHPAREDKWKGQSATKGESEGSLHN